MTKKKVYVKPHERQSKTGTNEHVRGHTRTQDVKDAVLRNQEIPKENEEDDTA